MSALKEELGFWPQRENNALYQYSLSVARMGKRCMKNLDDGDAKEFEHNLVRLEAALNSLRQVTNDVRKNLKIAKRKREGATNVVGIRSRLTNQT